MSATFPDVPVAPGVPPVFREGGFQSAAVIDRQQDALTNDAPGVAASSKTWGVYSDKDGTLALDPDNIVNVEPSREFRISDYPQEQGGFQSYNKVATPGELRFTVTKGGTDADRTAFLRVVESLIETTDLYTIATPNKIFPSFNLIRREYRQSAESGAALLIIEIQAIEVRQSAEAAYTKTTEPSGTDGVNGGPVRPQTPSDPVAAALKAEADAEKAQPFGVLF